MQKKIKILWIDSMPDSLRGFSDTLKSYFSSRDTRQEIGWATTREEAWKLLQEDDFQLLIIELALPKNESEKELCMISFNAGIDLLRRYHSEIVSVSNRQFPVIVFTTTGPGPRMKRAKRQLRDGDIYIEKTVTIKEFALRTSSIFDEVIRKTKGTT